MPTPAASPLTKAELLTRLAADLLTLGDEPLFNVTIHEFHRDWGGSGDTGVGDTTARHLAGVLLTRAREVTAGAHVIHTRQGSSIAGEFSSPMGD